MTINDHARWLFLQFVLAMVRGEKRGVRSEDAAVSCSRGGCEGVRRMLQSPLAASAISFCRSKRTETRPKTRVRKERGKEDTQAGELLTSEDGEKTRSEKNARATVRRFCGVKRGIAPLREQMVSIRFGAAQVRQHLASLLKQKTELQHQKRTCRLVIIRVEMAKRGVVRQK